MLTNYWHAEKKDLLTQLFHLARFYRVWNKEKRLNGENFLFIFEICFSAALFVRSVGIQGCAGSTDARLLSSGQKITHEPWADAAALSLGALQG